MFTNESNRIGQLVFTLFLSIGLLAGVGYWLSGGGMQTAVAAPARAPLANICWATIDGITVYSDTTSAPVQTAVNAAASGELVKVAGTCAGVQLRSGVTQTVYLNKNLSGLSLEVRLNIPRRLANRQFTTRISCTNIK